MGTFVFLLLYLSIYLIILVYNNINGHPSFMSDISNLNIESIIKSKEAFKLLFKFYYLKGHSKNLSDSHCVKLLNLLSKEDKDKVEDFDILEHLQRYPSERRFNILNKHFNLNNYSDKFKTDLLIMAFVEGKPKIFKRMLNLFKTDHILHSMNERIGCYFDYNEVARYFYTDFTQNIQVLKENIPSEIFKLFNENLIKAAFNTYQKNINPVFSQALDISSDSTKAETLNNYFKNLMHDKQTKALNITNQDIYLFLEKHNYFNYPEIHTYDQVRLHSYFLSKVENPELFINKTFPQSNDLCSLINEKEACFEIFFKQLINKNINEHNSVKGFKKYITALFLVLNRMNDDSFIHHVKNLKHHDHIISDDYRFKAPILEHYRLTFIHSLNQRLHIKNQIEITPEQFTNNDDLVTLYKIKKEKDFINNALNQNTNNEPVIKKRI